MRLGIPPTEVGGWFKSGLQGAATGFLNPTNFRWWDFRVCSVKLTLAVQRDIAAEVF